MNRTVSRTLLLGGITMFGPITILTAHAVELRVTGRIVPDACLTFFSGDGVVNYGPLSASESGTTRILARKSISLAVTCPTPSRVAIRLIDNRDNSAIPRMQAVAARYRNSNYLFGLGGQTGKNTGGYTISYKPLLKHASLGLLESSAGSDAIHWSALDDSMLRKDVLYSWDAIHKMHPAGALNFQAIFAIQPVLDSADNASANGDAQIDGSATFELLYL